MARAVVCLLAFITMCGVMARGILVTGGRRQDVNSKSVYVTFVSNPEYWKYAFVLTSTLRETGQTLPHVYMVKKGSPEAAAAPKIEQVAARRGLNIKLETYEPITVPWKTAFTFWDEAWQRVVLYNTSQFTRMLHLDADIVAYGNSEHILTHGKIPLAARRMGACKDPINMCATAPVSNVMLIEPSEGIAGTIHEWLQDKNGGGDETRQFTLHKNLSLLSPHDVLYSDCLDNEAPRADLTSMGITTSTMPTLVHLGIPFKALVESHGDISSMTQAAAIAEELVKLGNPWKASLVERWYTHFFSEDVQAMLAEVADAYDMVGDRKQSKGNYSEQAMRDVCD